MSICKYEMFKLTKSLVDSNLNWRSFFFLVSQKIIVRNGPVGVLEYMFDYIHIFLTSYHSKVVLSLNHVSLYLLFNKLKNPK